MVVPHLAGWFAFFEKEDDCFDSCTLEGPTREVEDGVEVAVLQQELAQAHRGIVGVREKGVFDDDTCAATCAEDLDEVLEKEEGGLACFDREVLLDLAADARAKRRVGEDDVVAVFLLDVGDILCECVAVHDVGRFDAMEDHVHRADDVGERLYLFAVESFLLERGDVRRRELRAVATHIDKPFGQEARRADCPVVDRLAYLRVDDFDDGADERARGIKLAAIATRVAHVLYLVFVEM